MTPAEMRRVLFVFVAFAIPAAFAGILDDARDLEGKTVIYAGDFEEIHCPVSGKYDCLQWPSNLLQATGKGWCFSADTLRCSYSCKGVIAVGTDRQPYVFVIDNMGGDMHKGRLQSYKCPDRF